MRPQIGSILTLSILILVGCSQPTDSQTETQPAKSDVAAACNFQSSYMTWDLPPRPDPRPYARHNLPLGNKVRIQLEALIDVIDEASGESERFVLIAPCRTEWVYAEDRLFQIPSTEYRMIYSLKDHRGMGSKIMYQGPSSKGEPHFPNFSSVEIDVQTFTGTRQLKTPTEINSATETNIPLVARTEIRDAKRGRRYVMEYPIRTMNFRPEAGSFQVDTGPLLVPDLNSDEEKPIDRLEMAHVVYNRLDKAEFILRRPTPIADESAAEVTKVLHYSEVVEHPAETVLLAAE